MAYHAVYRLIMLSMMKMKTFSDQRFQRVDQIVYCSVVLVIMKLTWVFINSLSSQVIITFEII